MCGEVSFDGTGEHRPRGDGLFVPRREAGWVRFIESRDETEGESVAQTLRWRHQRCKPTCCFCFCFYVCVCMLIHDSGICTSPLIIVL